MAWLILWLHFLWDFLDRLLCLDVLFQMELELKHKQENIFKIFTSKSYLIVLSFKYQNAKFYLEKRKKYISNFKAFTVGIEKIWYSVVSCLIQQFKLSFNTIKKTFKYFSFIFYHLDHTVFFTVQLTSLSVPQRFLTLRNAEHLEQL